MQVILASASPRRLALLEQIGLEVQVCPADFAEVSGAALDVESVVRTNALGKCQAVVAQLGDEKPVIAADTVVVAAGKILGKPRDPQEAVAMLQLLSGKEHRVLTGIAVSYAGHQLVEAVTTKVYFRDLSLQEIKAYVATGEPLDKAGAYGIQGRGAVLVTKIDGCYNNVVGLPLTRLQRMLAELQGR